MHGIITAHPFFDGNKRTAVLTCLTFLDLNHRPLKSDSDELFRVAIAVATHEMDVEQLAAWLEQQT
ncbi:MAG: death-on-curing family protein [Paenibacillus sp.]|jgi:death-on-curing protein|nr:death-on-curing family protein [Paenibacillus sp.]